MSETVTMALSGANTAAFSFDALYRDAAADVHAYAWSVLRDRAAAEDVTALAFERAYRRRARFDPRRGSARAWLFAIARNAALDELREQGAELVEVTVGNTDAPGILNDEFERDLDAYLDRLPEEAPIDSLDELIAFNEANAAIALKSRGALSVDVYVTHGVLSGNAVPKIEASVMESLTMTDSIMPTETARDASSIRVLTIAPILAEAMQRISDETSVSSLFD